MRRSTDTDSAVAMGSAGTFQTARSSGAVDFVLCRLSETIKALASYESPVALDIYRIVVGSLLSGWSMSRLFEATSSQSAHALAELNGAERLSSLAWGSYVGVHHMWLANAVLFILVAVGVAPRASALTAALATRELVDAGASGAKFELVVMGMIAFSTALLPVGSRFSLSALLRRVPENTVVPGLGLKMFVLSLGILYSNLFFWRSNYLGLQCDRGSIVALGAIPCLMAGTRYRSVSIALLLIQPCAHFVLWWIYGLPWLHLTLAATTLVSCRDVVNGNATGRQAGEAKLVGALSQPLLVSWICVIATLLGAQFLGAEANVQVASKLLHDTGSLHQWLLVK